MTRKPQTDPIVIIGAGPVGLLLACELGTRSVPVIVVEARHEHLRHPKANTMSARSMEIYRRQGMSGTIRAQGGLPPERRTDVGYFTRLFGRELHRVPLPSSQEALATARAGDPRWPTPEPQFRTTQMTLEPVLLAKARSFPSVDIRFDTQAITLEQDEAGVTLGLETADGTKSELRASHVVGCDGGKSFVRKALDLRFEGEGGLSMDFLGGRMLATYFEAPDLLSRFPHADTWMHWVMQPSGRSILLVINPARHEFLAHFQLGPDQQMADIDFRARLAEILGEDIPHRIISMAEWRAGMGLVSRLYGIGRCFLAGDAAHLFTPTGGFGLNTGIEDSFNLGWKLAAVHKGIADSRLLETYHQERHPIGVRNTSYALSLAQKNGACPTSPALDEDGAEGEKARAATAEHLRNFARWEFDTPGVQLGARYDDSPLTIADGTTGPADSAVEYIPRPTPGGRLPHVWVEDGVSVFDRLGSEFTLLCLGDDAEVQPWLDAARALGLDLHVTVAAADPVYVGDAGADALLVRPDQHVAWRGKRAGSDPRSVLEAAIGLS